jgi:hypothetical protein
MDLVLLPVDMHFAEWFRPPRSSNNWLSWRSLILAFPFVSLLTITICDGHKEAAVAIREQKAEGVVTGCDPSNHDWCHYKFSFRERTFEGFGGWLGERPSTGQHVTVFFDPEDPETSSLEDYASPDRQERAIAPQVMFGVLTVVVIVVSLYLRRREIGMMPRSR